MAHEPLDRAGRWVVAIPVVILVTLVMFAFLPTVLDVGGTFTSALNDNRSAVNTTTGSAVIAVGSAFVLIGLVVMVVVAVVIAGLDIMG